MIDLNNERNRPRVISSALLAIALAGGAIFWTLHSPRASSASKPLEGLGAALAQAAIQAVGNHGQIVLVTFSLVQSRPPGFPAPAGSQTMDPAHPVAAPAAPPIQPQLDGFRNALRAYPGVVIIGTESVELGLAPGALATPDRDSVANYFELATKYPNADAIVSLTDAPNLDPEDLRRLPKHLPKVITLANISDVPNLRRLFEAGVLHTAILPRREPAPETAPPRTPAEWFARYFWVVTPANIDLLPKPLS